MKLKCQAPISSGAITGRKVGVLFRRDDACKYSTDGQRIGGGAAIARVSVMAANCLNDRNIAYPFNTSPSSPVPDQTRITQIG